METTRLLTYHIGDQWIDQIIQEWKNTKQDNKMAILLLYALHFHDSNRLHHVDVLPEEERLEQLNWKANFWYQNEIYLIDTPFKIPYQKWLCQQRQLTEISKKLISIPENIFWETFYYSFSADIYQKAIHNISEERLLIQLWDDDKIDSFIKTELITALGISLKPLIKQQFERTAQSFKYIKGWMDNNRISGSWLKEITRDFLVYGILPASLIELSRLYTVKRMINQPISLTEIANYKINKIRNYRHILDAVDLPTTLKQIFRKYCNETNTAKLILPEKNPLITLTNLPIEWLPEEDFYEDLLNELKNMTQEELLRESLSRHPWTLPYSDVIQSDTYQKDLLEIYTAKPQLISILKKNYDFWHVIVSVGNAELINDLLRTPGLASPFGEDLEQIVNKMYYDKFAH